MVRIRQGWVVAVLGLGLLAGCKKDDKSASPSGDRAAETSGGASGAASGDDLALLPADSELVLGINAGQVQQSALWKQFVEPKLMTGEAQSKLAELKAKCGYDPVASVKSVSVGMKGLSDGKPSGVIVVHGLDKGKTLDCLDKHKGEIAKDGTEMTRDGDVVLLKNQRGEQTAFSFVGADTALAVVGDNATAAGVKAATAGGSALKSSPAFLEMYKKVNSRDSLWGLANGKLMEKSPLPMKVNAVFGSLNATDGLALDLRIRFETADAATQAAGMANGQAKQAAAYVDKAEFTSEGPDLHASVVMSNQKLQSLLTQFGGLLGAMAGGMGGQ